MIFARERKKFPSALAIRIICVIICGISEESVVEDGRRRPARPTEGAKLSGAAQDSGELPPDTTLESPSKRVPKGQKRAALFSISQAKGQSCTEPPA